MANIVTVPANVAVDSSVATNPLNGVSGETITAGDPVRVASDGKIWQGQADSLDNAAVKGLALNSTPGANQPIQYTTEGLIDLGVTIPDGTVVAVSATKGKLCPVGDLITGNFTTVVGVAKGDKVLLGVLETGLAVP